MTRAAFWSREIPVRQIGCILLDHPVRVMLGAGVLFRVAAYLANRPFWMDESSLVGCITQLDETGLFGPLGSTQLAPPGFLAVEWLVSCGLGTSPFAFRLVPLLAGIAALFWFRNLSRCCLQTASGELWAVASFAVADDLIYFCSEAKQYSSDLALSLGCLLIALRSAAEPFPTARRVVGLAAFGAGVVWFSHPAVFTLAAIGLVGLSQALQRRSLPRSAAWISIGAAWVTSFAIVHAVAMQQLGHRRDMWFFWDFAFPPLPPRSAWDLSWPARRFAFLFASPLNFDAPIGPRWSIWPALVLVGIGWSRMAPVSPSRTALITLPGVFALLAAYGRLYPFHGRLLLFCVPLTLIPLAAGLDAVRIKPLRWLLLIWVLGFPTLNAAYRLVEPRQRDVHSPYGDRRPASLNPYWFPLAAPTDASRRGTVGRGGGN